MQQDFDEYGRGYWFLEDLDKRTDSSTDPQAGQAIDHEKREPATKTTANLISSQTFGGKHAPVLDIDGWPMRVVPSTTPGNSHLYIDRPISWRSYEKLIKVLGEIGILEPGYVGAALRRQATFVRPPWVKKPASAPPAKGIKSSEPFGQCAYSKPLPVKTGIEGTVADESPWPGGPEDFGGSDYP